MCHPRVYVPQKPHRPSEKLEKMVIDLWFPMLYYFRKHGKY
jgi:hypothetical protein